MLRMSDWTEFSSMDTVAPARSYALTLAHVFSSYLNGDTDFDALHGQVVSAYQELRQNGASGETAFRSVRVELDRGAAHCTPCENVHRFNAIHDELRSWLVRVCTDDYGAYPTGNSADATRLTR
jgi:hypothetical protein